MSPATRLAGPAILGAIAIAAYELDAPSWIAIAARVACGAWLAIAALGGARQALDAMATGVLFAGIADAVLALSSSSARLFIVAMGLFAAGHVALAKGLWRLGRVGAARATTTLVPLAVYACGVVAVLWPSLGALRGPVIGYVAILTLMCWRACLAAQGATRAEASTRAAYAIGGVLFVLGDTILAVHKFRTPISHQKLFALAPYWLSLAAFVIAIARQPSESIRKARPEGGAGRSPV
jgi:uncharacterized membrane protein YhhN